MPKTRELEKSGNKIAVRSLHSGQWQTIGFVCPAKPMDTVLHDEITNYPHWACQLDDDRIFAQFTATIRDAVRVLEQWHTSQQQHFGQNDELLLSDPVQFAQWRSTMSFCDVEDDR